MDALPCPFCRSKNVFLHILGYGPLTDQLRWIECNNCNARGPSIRNTKLAIKFWNDYLKIKEE